LGSIRKKIKGVAGLFSRDRATRIKSLFHLNGVAGRIAASKIAPLRWAGLVLGRYAVSAWFKETLTRSRELYPMSQAVLDQPIYDLVFFVPDKSRGWILEAICKDIAKEFRGSHTTHFSYRDLPRARGYFISHYSQLDQIAAFSPHVMDAKILMLFTHPRDDMQFPFSFYARLMNFADHILLMNSGSRDLLASYGTKTKNMKVVVRAADPDLFVQHARTGQGKVGLSTAFYERKRPELVLDLVRALPHRKFILLGRRWKEWKRFSELSKLENFEYVEAEYAEYPGYYAQMDVFVSPAFLEGGPFPLLESMMCNVVPVASRTGYALDLIRHGENGFVFDVEEKAEVVASLVEKAFQMKTDVASEVRQFTWKRLASEIQNMI